MAFPRPAKQEIEQLIYNSIRANSALTANLESSLIGLIVKVTAASMDQLWEAQQQTAINSQITTAGGSSLDILGLDLGVPRREDRQASTLGLARAVRFTNVGVSTVTVPAGTRVYKRTSPQLAFLTTEGATLSPSQTAEVHASAVDNGELFNVGVGELDTHNVPAVSVQVTNILPIETGSFRESDESYRERLVQEYRRRRVLNVSNLDALMRSVPGVQDVYVLNKRRGEGTCDVIVIPRSFTNISAVVDECNRLITQNAPVGTSIRALAPRYRQLDVQINLRFTSSTNVDREVIRESIRQQIRTRVDNLPVEDGSGAGSLYTGQLQALAGNASTSVLEAVGVFGLDGTPLSSNGEVRLNVGERITLRALEVN